MPSKTHIFTLIVILTNVAGNLLLSMGMHRVGSLLGLPPTAYILALFQPLVAAGVALLIVWMISQLTLLSWADLSFVMPVTSIGYVLSALVGRVFLHEQVSWRRWGGIWLIVIGVMLVSRTSPIANKTPAKEEQPQEMVCS
jgi:drug/metabolite transporter (DMT)-like permease